MNNPFKKTRHTLSHKLKGALTDLSVDVFGYEKQLTKNILNHTHYISRKLDIPKERLYIRIFQKNHVIRAFLYNQDAPLHAITMEVLSHFFLDPGAATLINNHNKMAFSIKQYLKAFAEANKIYEESIQIWINTKETTVEVRAFQDNEFIKDITLLSLIKYFR